MLSASPFHSFIDSKLTKAYTPSDEFTTELREQREIFVQLKRLLN